MDLRFVNNMNTTKVPGYMRYDAAVAGTPSQGTLNGYRLQFNVPNLTNTRTFDTVYTGPTVPGIGRMMVLTLAAQF